MTLVEVLVSASILAVLMGGMASAVALASKAIPKSGTNVSVSQARVCMSEALDQIEADLMCAKTVTELSANAVTVTVADRGHGVAGDETIRYAWSGVAGTPLTRSYNGGAAVTLASDVANFGLAASVGAGEIGTAPRVLMVVDKKTSLWDPQETTQKAKLEQWGYLVTTLRCDATAGELATALATADVVYVTVYASCFGGMTTLMSSGCGVIVECESLAPSLRLTTGSSSSTGVSVVPLDSTHPILSGFPLSPVPIVVTTGVSQLSVHTGASSGGKALSTVTGTMYAWDVGSLDVTGAEVAGRRVLMPWGGTGFDNVRMTDDGWYLLKRTVAWAAAPKVYTGLTVTLKGTKVAAMRTGVRMLNTPRVGR